MRMITNIFLIVFIANALTGVFAAAGVWDDYGAKYDTDLGGSLDKVVDKAENLIGGQGGEIGGTLIDLIQSGLTLIIQVIDVAIFGSAKLLSAFGTPQYIVDMVKTLVIIIAGLNIVAYRSGRET